MSQAIHVRPASAADIDAIATLNAQTFGPGRFVRTAYRVREGMPLVSPFCKVCVTEGGTLIAAVRLSPILIGGQAGAVLLGPLAVAPDYAGQGHGRNLVAESLAEAKAKGIRLVLLVGDAPYYERLGFQRVPFGQIILPGPVDPARLLAAELADGALAAARGLVAADRASA